VNKSAKSFIGLVVSLNMAALPQYYIASASEVSNSDIAEAVVYSACTYGLVLDPAQMNLQVIQKSNIDTILNFRIIDGGNATASLAENDNPRARTGYENVVQGFTTARVLDKKWSPLAPALENAMTIGLKKWNSGFTFGQAQQAAETSALSTMTALCRIAQIGVSSKAKKTKMSLRSYVIKTAGQYLPPLPK
jgi:hypothetical protein